MRYDDHIFAAHVDLMPSVPLNVYALRGALRDGTSFRLGGDLGPEVQVDELVEEGALKRTGGRIARA